MAQLICNEFWKVHEHPKSTAELIGFAIDKDILNEIFIIVPTGKIVRKLSNRIIRDYFRKYSRPVSKPNVFTLQNFIRFVFEKLQLSINKRIISDRYKLVLLEEAIKQSDLQYYKKSGDSLSFSMLMKLNRVINGLKEDGMNVSSMNKRLSDYTERSDGTLDEKKYSDIKVIFENYEKIKEDKLLDSNDLIGQILNCLPPEIGLKKDLFFIQNKLKDIFFNENESNVTNFDPIIFFEGFSEFKRPEIEFLKLFVKSGFPVAVRMDFLLNDKENLSNGPLFGNLESSIIDLSDSGFRLINLDEATQKQEIGVDEIIPTAFLRRWLFNVEGKINCSVFSDKISIFEAENKEDEAKVIAKLIRYLVFEKNYKLSDICIVMRQPELYTGMFRDVFKEYKISANITDRYKLSSSNVVVSVLSVLELLINDYKKEDVHKLMSNRYLSVGTDLAIEHSQSDKLYSAALKLRINGGKAGGGSLGWKKRLEFKIASLEKLLGNVDLSIDDEHEADAYKRDLEDFRIALSQFLELESKMYFVGADKNPINLELMHPVEFKHLIKEQIIKGLNVKNNIYELFKSQTRNFIEKSVDEKIFFAESVEKDVQALLEFENAVEELTEILIERFPGVKFSLNYLYQKLKLMILESKYQIKEKRNYGVTITSIEQIRSLDFKISILCGAIDKEFPIIYRPETFLGEELPETEDRHICSERMQFYQFLTNSPELLDNGEKLIYIFYPKFNEEEQLVRSPFIDALLRITTIEDSKKIYNLSDVRKEYSAAETDLKTKIDEIPFVFSVASDNEKYGTVGDKLNQKTLEEIVADFNIISPENLNTIKFLKSELNQVRSASIDWEKVKTNNLSFFENIHNKSFSITELENYISCPFKYYLKYVLRLQEPETEEYGLTSLETGSLYHSILYRFFTKIRLGYIQEEIGNLIESVNGNLPLVNVDLIESNKANYLQELILIAQEEISKIYFQHPYFEYQKNEIIGTPQKIGLLETWLISEFDRKFSNELSDFSPVLFELSFGNSKTTENAISEIDLDDGFKLKGKIDRLELSEVNEIMVADYKTTKNSIPAAKSYNKGESLQIPLYLIAAQKILKQNYDIECEPKQGVYYILKPEYNSKFGKTPTQNQRFESYKHFKLTDKGVYILDLALEQAKKTRNSILAGNFPVEPNADKDPCKYCNFKSVCRIGAK